MNIEDYAISAVYDAIDNGASVDVLDNLDDAITTRVYETAESACVYYTACMDLINELESEYGANYDDDGCTYSAEDWQKAMVAYAYQLTTSALFSETNQLIETMRENLELFNTEVERLGGDIDAATLSSDCQHGWAAHNYETMEGVHVWSDERNSPNGCFNPELLEGECIAVAFELGAGIWVDICWTPESNTDAA